MSCLQRPGAQYIRPIAGNLVRIVESQQHIATAAYVDTLEEQDVLEQMLESSKPPLLSPVGRLHYLLASPFRYPPLAWGSRFGHRYEPSLFYGADTVDTALAESAYYRFVFWWSMAGSAPSDRILTSHTTFQVGYGHDCGVQLQHAPFDIEALVLTNPGHYAPTQQLGSDMRAAGVAVFEYPSARARQLGHQGTGVALFYPDALSNTHPSQQADWLCETCASHVSFHKAGEQGTRVFPYEQFTVDGRLPVPA